MYKFRVSLSESKYYYFVLFSETGKVVLNSALYRTLQAVRKAMVSVKYNSSDDLKFEKIESNEKYFFTLKAGNEQIIGTSENYDSLKEVEEAIEGFKTNVGNSEVEENFSDKGWFCK
ncbi:hypothetical protein BKN14_00880 [Candidatus Gracilibacteria bacterium HOT-871]|nr:hypothetical protein BKN14_00880 [Candidatus Gracilibacteria bacterium HOT-871]MBB1564534.1 YegP family protein [Candidatus Gracilibacteria bacterium]MBF0913514.1 YegP family protein [Candidatus Gracilibacteria bacterium]RKW21921.1 MAG: DUF1508 domain-containing protein [Candidatus Gracilibacteria bacterium]